MIYDYGELKAHLRDVHGGLIQLPEYFIRYVHQKVKKSKRELQVRLRRLEPEELGAAARIKEERAAAEAAKGRSTPVAGNDADGVGTSEGAAANEEEEMDAFVGSIEQPTNRVQMEQATSGRGAPKKRTAGKTPAGPKSAVQKRARKEQEATSPTEKSGPGPASTVVRPRIAARDPLQTDGGGTSGKEGAVAPPNDQSPEAQNTSGKQSSGVQRQQQRQEEQSQPEVETHDAQLLQQPQPQQLQQPLSQPLLPQQHLSRQELQVQRPLPQQQEQQQEQQEPVQANVALVVLDPGQLEQQQQQLQVQQKQILLQHQKVQQQNLQLMQLKNQNSQLQELNTKMSREKEELMRHNRDLKRQSDNLRQLFKGMELKVADMKSEAESHQRQHAKLLAEIAGLRKELEKARRKGDSGTAPGDISEDDDDFGACNDDLMEPDVNYSDEDVEGEDAEESEEVTKPQQSPGSSPQQQQQQGQHGLFLLKQPNGQQQIVQLRLTKPEAPREQPVVKPCQVKLVFIDPAQLQQEQREQQQRAQQKHEHLRRQGQLQKEWRQQQKKGQKVKIKFATVPSLPDPNPPMQQSAKMKRKRKRKVPLVQQVPMVGLMDKMKETIKKQQQQAAEDQTAAEKQAPKKKVTQVQGNRVNKEDEEAGSSGDQDADKTAEVTGDISKSADSTEVGRVHDSDDSDSGEGKEKTEEGSEEKATNPGIEASQKNNETKPAEETEGEKDPSIGRPRRSRKTPRWFTGGADNLPEDTGDPAYISSDEGSCYRPSGPESEDESSDGGDDGEHVDKEESEAPKAKDKEVPTETEKVTPSKGDTATAERTTNTTPKKISEAAGPSSSRVTHRPTKEKARLNPSNVCAVDGLVRKFIK